MNTDKTEQVKVDQFKYAQSLFVECFLGEGKKLFVILVAEALVDL